MLIMSVPVLVILLYIFFCLSIYLPMVFVAVIFNKTELNMQAAHIKWQADKYMTFHYHLFCEYLVHTECAIHSTSYA